MTPTTALILSIADNFSGGRGQLFEDLADIIGDKKFFTVDSVAKRYQVSVQTVKDWTTKGLLCPSFKVKGGTSRYTLSDLLKFENQNKRSSEDEDFNTRD